MTYYADKTIKDIQRELRIKRLIEQVKADGGQIKKKYKELENECTTEI